MKQLSFVIILIFSSRLILVRMLDPEHIWECRAQRTSGNAGRKAGIYLKCGAHIFYNWADRQSTYRYVFWGMEKTEETYEDTWTT